MTRMGRAARAARGAMLGVLLLLAATPQLAAAANRQQDTEARLAEVRSRIDALGAQQREAEAERDAAGARLRSQAQALAQAGAALERSAAKLAALEVDLARLEARQAELDGELDAQREAVGELLRATYKLGRGSDLRLLLGHVEHCAEGEAGAGCAAGASALGRLQRALAYSRHFQKDRAARIRALLDRLGEQAQLREEATARRDEVAAERAVQLRQRETLTQERVAQQALLARVEAQIGSRAQALAALEAERGQLEALLAELRDLFADIPSELPDAVPFARRRGQLPWPLAGTAEARGAGVLIAAEAGSRVRAVAHGRVAWADWLRGYGMLVIIDHGEGWMSLYGNNERLTRAVGDWVDAGAVIARSGRGEGVPAGLFFALRHAGKPVAPLPWLEPR